MTEQNKPDDHAGSADETDAMRTMQTIADALQGGDIDALAAALSHRPEPALPAPANDRRRSETNRA